MTIWGRRYPPTLPRPPPLAQERNTKPGAGLATVLPGLSRVCPSTIRVSTFPIPTATFLP